MKLLRDESATSLIKKLSFLGYNQTRLTGSHIRITRTFEGKDQHITIPNHNPIRIGTFSYFEGGCPTIGNFKRRFNQ